MSYRDLLDELSAADHAADKLHARPSARTEWIRARHAARSGLLARIAGLQPIDLEHPQGPEARIITWLAGYDATTVAAVGSLMEHAANRSHR